MRERLGRIGLSVLRAVLTAIFTSAPVHVAQAAFIEKKPLGPESPDLIMVFGELEARDIERFRDVATNTPEAIVALAGPGGSVAAGIEIGHMIRLRNYKTVVFGDQQCASSCALAWLGGAQRFMAESAKIGFHAASDGRSGQVSGAGNALVGAYLNRIGLQASAIVYITQAGPDGMIWLSPAQAKRYGIEVQALQSQQRPRSDNGAFGLSAPAAFGRGVAQAAASSAGHSYSLECNEHGFVLRSDSPVIRWARRGFHDMRKLDPETIYLGKDCDVFHKDLGWRGKWGWANGGVKIEFENTAGSFGAYGQFQPDMIGFPRADIDVWADQCPRDLDLTNCRP
jgi:ATP-dependent protease ClpP protease subunit